MTTISEVAKELSVSTATIRVWERKGLIPKSVRTLGGHRRYNLEVIKKIFEDHNK